MAASVGQANTSNNEFVILQQYTRTLYMMMSAKYGIRYIDTIWYIHSQGMLLNIAAEDRMWKFSCVFLFPMHVLLVSRSAGL